jgi:streptogramin lyase
MTGGRFPALFATVLVLGAAGAATAHPGASIAIGRDGRVYFVDTGGGIFEIGRNGRVSRREGPALHWFAIDRTSRLAKTRWPTFAGAEIRSVGVDPTLVLSSDFPVATGADGHLYYPEPAPQGPRRIVRVAPSGARSMHATIPEERRPDGSPGWVNGIVAGPGGSLYYTHDRTIRKISPRGVVSTLAASVTVPGCVAIPGIEAPTGPYLRGLDVAADGTVFVAAAGCGAVLKVSPTGSLTPILRTSSPYSPTAVAVLNGEVYVLEYLHTASDDRREWLPRVRKLTRTGTVVTLANTTSR